MNFIRVFSRFTNFVLKKVRPSQNRVYVCSSSQNSIKVYDQISGKILIVVDGSQNKGEISKFYLNRPSAILIEETTSEVFVKDDINDFTYLGQTIYQNHTPEQLNMKQSADMHETVSCST